VGASNNVVVENEFHLPSITVTRVKAGEVVKTVWTATLPLKDKKTRLFWRVYRNFWLDPVIPLFSVIGDYFLDFLMRKTIQEDVEILGKINEKQRFGSLKTKFDVTILKYRHDKQKWLEKQGHV
jgi:hypothetical protein